MENLSGPPEPIGEDGALKVAYIQNGDWNSVGVGKWRCGRCDATEENGLPTPPKHKCTACDRQTAWVHIGGIDEDAIKAAEQAQSAWYPPGGVEPTDLGELWADVRAFIHQYWDGDREIYDGLTAFALSTWVRPNLEFVPHLMLMGHTTSGKTRLLNTLARVSYRAVVSASATPASMFRLIDGYDVTFFVSEYHGLHSDTRRELDSIVRAGQKRGETVTRAEPTNSGYEPETFDPFTHVAIATQYEPPDDIINRCIQGKSSPAKRDVPATFDEDAARKLRSRLLWFRYRVLGSDVWDDAEAAAYDHLAEEGITGRTREKLLSILTVATVCDKADRLESEEDTVGFIDRVVRQDRQAAADSEDALFVEVVHDLAFDQLDQTTIVGDDPLSAVRIALSDICEEYERRTGIEKTPSWAGQLRSRLDLGKTRTSDGTVISDDELGPKLKGLCEDLELEWDPPEKVPAYTDDAQDDVSNGNQYVGGDGSPPARAITNGGAQLDLRETILEQFEGGDKRPAPEAVLAYTEAKGFDRSRAEHRLEQLRAEGAIIERPDGLELLRGGG